MNLPSNEITPNSHQSYLCVTQLYIVRTKQQSNIENAVQSNCEDYYIEWFETKSFCLMETTVDPGGTTWMPFHNDYAQIVYDCFLSSPIIIVFTIVSPTLIFHS